MVKRVEPEIERHEPELVSPKVGGQILGYSDRHMRNMAKAGVIPFVRLGARGIRFRPASLRRVVAEAETVAS